MARSTMVAAAAVVATMGGVDKCTVVNGSRCIHEHKGSVNNEPNEKWDNGANRVNDGDKHSSTNAVPLNEQANKI
eukprot:5829161-Amphidinium_carterae.1